MRKRFLLKLILSSVAAFVCISNVSLIGPSFSHNYFHQTLASDGDDLSPNSTLNEDAIGNVVDNLFNEPIVVDNLKIVESVPWYKNISFYAAGINVLLSLTEIAINLATDKTDEIVEKFNEVTESMAELNNKINQINNKINDMAELLDESFAEIDVNFSKQRIREDINIISKFNLSSYNNYLIQIDTTINSKFVDFADYKHYTYPEYYKFDQSFITELGEIANKDIIIDGDIVKNAIENSAPLNVNDIEGWTATVFEFVYDYYLNSPTLFSSSGLQQALENHRSCNLTDDTFKAAFTSGFYDYIYQSFFKEIVAKTTQGKTFVGDVINSFEAYCRDLSKVYSPLYCQYDIFAHAFCFQKDANYVVNGDTRSLIVDLGLSYILDIIRYSCFAVEASILSGFVTNEKICSLVKQAYNTINCVIRQIQTFYKVDEYGQPLDYYCYKTKCVLSIEETRIYNNSEPQTGVGFKKGDKILADGYDQEKFKESTKFTALEHTPVSPNDLSYLYTLYNSLLVNTTGVSFESYLNALFPNLDNRNVVLKYDGFSSFDVNEKSYLMNVHQFGNNDDGHLINNNYDVEKYGDHRVILGDSGYNKEQWTIKNEDYRISQELTGTYFDLSNGKIHKDDSIYSYCLYYSTNDGDDDVAWLTSATIAGKENEVINNNTTDLWYENTTIPYEDYTSSLNFDHSYLYDGYEFKTFNVDIDFSLPSFVYEPVKYGVWQLPNGAFSRFFNEYEYDDINIKIKNLNYQLPDIEEIPSLTVPNNGSLIWAQYDEYEYKDMKSTFAQYVGSDVNLIKLSNAYYNFLSNFSDVYSRVIEDESPILENLVEINLDEDQMSLILTQLNLSLKEMEISGVEYGDLKLPGEDAYDIKLLAKINPQMGQVLSLNSDNEIVEELIPTYIVTPVLSYKENWQTMVYELPHQLMGGIDISKCNLRLNLPVLNKDKTSNQAMFKFNKDISNYSSNEGYLLVGDILNKENDNYAAIKITSFGAYSYLGTVEKEYPEYSRVAGKEPTCCDSGYLPAYISGGTYYSKPGEVIGDQDAYDLWIREGGAGYLEATGEHNCKCVESNYNPQNHKFTFSIECVNPGCNYTNSETVDGDFVRTKDPTCYSEEEGYYVGIYKFDDVGLECIVSNQDNIEIVPNSKLPHSLTHIDEKDSCCTEEGNIEHYICDICGATFLDAEATQPIDNVIKPALGHNPIKVPRKEATPQENGNIEYYYCSRCEKLFLDVECTIEINFIDTIIVATDYTYEKIDKLDSTHFNGGHQRYYYCPQKDKYYLDACGLQEIDDINKWLSPGGLGYIEKEPCTFDGEIRYVVNGNTCTATRNCTHTGCNCSLNETVDLNFIIDTPATCTHNAYGHLEAVFTNPDFDKYSTPTNSYEFKDTKLKHDIDQSSVRYVWNEDNDICTAIITCNDCGQTLPIVGESKLVIDTPATCTNDAVGHYEATFPGQQLEKQIGSQFTIEGTAHGHHYENGVCEDCGLNDPNYVKPESLGIGGVIAICVSSSILAVAVVLLLQFLVFKKKKI